MEDLKNITQNTKGRINKATRKLLGNWNVALTYRRIEDKCNVRGTKLVFVNPSYTSQTCSHCGVIHKESRKGEMYKCKECGSVMDADINGAINILHRFLNKESTVPYDIKKYAT